MALTAEQKAIREGRLTASRVACLMKGDNAEIMKLWEEMVGSREDTDDLANHWPAVLGSTTEGINLDWWEKKTGHPVTRRGEVVIGQRDWMACTLDGWDDTDAHPIEAKHVGGFEPAETIIARYQPQMHWTMIVTRANKIGLSVIYGAKEPTREIIEFDEAYAKLLIERAEKFMEYVWAFTPPVAVVPIEPPVVADKVIDMKTTRKANQWADSAAIWLEHVDHVEKAKDAEKELKGMMPEEAKQAHGFGVVITRNKAGALSLRKEKS